jgi:outer membrane immunogenic protein
MTRTLLFASAAFSAAMLPLGAANAADPLAAVPINWSSFYAGIHGGWLNGDVKIEEYGEQITGNVSGTVLGVLAGVDFFYPPASPFILGIEADLGWVDAHGSGGDETDACVDFLYDVTWNGHLRGRASYPAGPVTPFVAVGLAVADLNVREGCGVSAPAGGLFFGGTIGAGIDFRALQNVALRGEVLYDFYHPKNYEHYSVDFSSWTARFALIWQLW